ncbi:BSD domain-containing protein [Trichinella spiralis]|uniref:BSD domain-containing protein n=1 Tax=Trichinella spiralis TaxID=6334 RepID=A0ABR3KZB1_TRISP
MKYWSCCEKKTSNFDDFLNQVGCETGKHDFSVQEEHKRSKCRFDWFQTADNVYVNVYAKLINPTKTEIATSDQTLRGKVYYNNQDDIFELNIPLWAPVIPSESVVNISSSKLEIVLRKTENRLLRIVQMNEQADDERFGSNFFQSFFDQAREKTMSTLALVKRDLVELGETFQQEASSLITVTANVIREHAPPLNAEVASNWMKAVVDSVSYVLSEKDTAVGEEEFEIPIVAPLDNGKYDSVRALQMDPETFCTDPEGAAELYEDWKSNFNLRHYEEECKEIFRNCPSVRRMYLQLVPNEIDSIQFWQRYFYRVHQHQLDKARKRYFADEQLFAEKKKTNDWISQEMPGDLSQTGLMHDHRFFYK